MHMCVCLTYFCQGLVKNWVERGLQILLDVLQQNRTPKLDGALQHLQVVWHLKVYQFQTLHTGTHEGQRRSKSYMNSIPYHSHRNSIESDQIPIKI